MLDTLGHAQGRPGASPFIVGLYGGVQSGEGGVGIEQRRTAEDHLAFLVAFL